MNHHRLYFRYCPTVVTFLLLLLMLTTTVTQGALGVSLAEGQRPLANKRTKQTENQGE